MFRTVKRLLLGSALAVAVVAGTWAGCRPASADSKSAPRADSFGAPRSDSKPFTVTVTPLAAKLGQPATTRVVFRPGPGYHMNLEYPTALKLMPPKEVSAAKALLSKPDVKLTEKEGQFDVVLTATEAGKKTVPGELRFAVCTATTCDPQRVPISIEMSVQ